MANFEDVAAPWWNDRPVVIVGGGPSLIGFDFNRLRGAHVLAVKGSIFDIPWADAGFGLDWPRFEEWRAKLMALPMRIYWAVPGDRIEECQVSENITYLERLDGEDLTTDASKVFVGGTSGFGALQVAIMKRATKIVLLGYDYNGNYSPGADFRHNQQRYEKKRKQERQNWEAWASYFDAIEGKIRTRGVEVINACPMSSVTAFRKTTIHDALTEIGL
jgi:hypothetical protein